MKDVLSGLLAALLIVLVTLSPFVVAQTGVGSRGTGASSSPTGLLGRANTWTAGQTINGALNPGLSITGTASGDDAIRIPSAGRISFNGSTSSVEVFSSTGTNLFLNAATDIILASASDTYVNLGGSGSSTGRVGGTVSANTTAVGNVGACGPDDLITYTLPASALSVNGEGVRIYAWGTTTNNVNAKTVELVFGSQVIMTQALTASIAGTWRIEARVFRNGTSTQDIFAELLQLATIVHKHTITAGTQTETATIVIKCQCAVGTTTNDIVQEGLHVEFIN